MNPTLELTHEAARHARCIYPRMSDLFQGVGPLSGALSYHMERHNVLTPNVAHIDTPGYKPKEVERTGSQDFGQMLSVAMTRTHEGHQASSGMDKTLDHGRVIASPDAFPSLDGNYVSLDVEATKLAENQLRYETVSRLTSAQLKQLAYVAGDGR